MAPLLAFAELAIAAAVMFFTCKSLRRSSAAWWATLAGTALLAGIASTWIAFHFSYHPSPQLIVHSFPLPAAFHALETYGDGTQQWVDFVTPQPALVAVANACLLTSIAVGGVWAALLIRLRHSPKPIAPN